MAAVTPRFGRALLRLFAVQGSYNYERMLGLGVGVAEEPLLRGLPADGSASPYRAAVARGAHFFNAHPYLAGLAVGAAARAEHDGAPAELVERLRAALCGPLGSIGDRLVWAGWLPLLSGLALAAVSLGAGWAAAVAFLVVYNIGHVALRWWALREGWKHGVRVASALNNPILQRGAVLAGPAMACAVGLALPLAAQFLAASFGAWGRAVIAAAAGVGFLGLYFLPGRVTGLRLGLGFAALALVAAWVWQ